jgi:hypothetical protein
LTHPLKEGGIAWIYPAFPLQGFQEHCRHPGTVGFSGGEQGLEGRRVVVGEVAEPLHHRLEALVVFGLAGGGHGGEGAAVEAGVGREDEGLGDAAHHVAMLAGQLDGGLVGFRPGIAEEHPIGTAAGTDRPR